MINEVPSDLMPLTRHLKMFFHGDSINSKTNLY